MTDDSVETAEEPPQRKSKPITFRATSRFRERVDLAVALTGQRRSDFIAEAIVTKMDAMRRLPHNLELSDRDMQAPRDTIENPPPPNEAMLRAIARWRSNFQPSE